MEARDSPCPLFLENASFFLSFFRDLLPCPVSLIESHFCGGSRAVALRRREGGWKHHSSSSSSVGRHSLTMLFCLSGPFPSLCLNLETERYPRSSPVQGPPQKLPLLRTLDIIVFLPFLVWGIAKRGIFTRGEASGPRTV